LIEFRILGPLEVVSEGRVLDIGAGKRRTLLAVLLLHANEVVSVDRLIDDVWGEQAPTTAPKIVQGYVSQLRKTLSDGDVLVTQPPGYVLRLDHGQLDAERFATLATEARAALAADAPGDASALLGEALSLMRGPPLGEFAFDSFAREEISRLDELSLAALEDRVEADLALGRHVELVPELEALVARHPLRERLRGQLMLALYRCGRQAEALKAYEVTRRVLVEELGIEPSRALQQLEQAILNQDPELDVRAAAAPASSEPQAQERGGADVFVGRERELATLLRALDDVLAGHGRLLAIGGEPGIGKSRLAEELSERAVARGADVVWGRCWDAGGAPPYWPWVQALRALGARAELPELAVPDAAGDPEQARFRLFDSVTSFLKSAARSRPLVLVLDDVNWADGDSLLLLEFVGRNLADAPVVLVVAYRDVELTRRHPLSRTLAELARARSFERVLLRGLTHDDVGRFVEATWGFAPDGALVEAVHAQTEGNPFFVREVVRLLAEEGALATGPRGTSEQWRARIPDGVREAIGRRLDRLSERCNGTLTVASALGRDFSVAHLTQVVETLSADDVLEALDEAVTARLVEEAPGTSGTYQFTHALIQATLLDDLSGTRRARLHARIAEMLEESYGEQAGAHAGELAHHFAEAHPVLGPSKLVRYSLLAGEAALTARAPEQALEHFERGLAARGDAAIDHEAVELLFGLARALLATLPPHEIDPAVTALRRVFDYYLERGETARAVAVAAHPLPLNLRFGYADAAELIARALTLATPESREAGSLLAHHGWFTGFIQGDYDEAQRSFREALSIAAREGDATLKRRALANAAFVDPFHLRWEECLTRGLQVLELAQVAGDPRTEIAARRALGFAFVATGKPGQAREQTTAAVKLAEQLRETWWVTSASWSNGVVFLYLGDFAGARRMAELGLAAEPHDPRHLALSALLEYDVGDLEVATARLARLQDLAATVPPPGPIADHVSAAGVSAFAGCVTGDERLFDAATAAAERLLSLPRLNPALTLYSRSALAVVAVQRGNADAAQALYAAIEPERGTASFFFPLTFDRLLGSLALTCGDVEASLGHFADGLAFCELTGYRPEYARTARDYATALRRAGDDARASELEAEAFALANDLGLRSLVTSADSSRPSR
jgi:DNA-binding SARP family transcriptional activator